ncbi:MAG TPA: cyclic nucleotide-binding domain-containing protein [Candidatus Limnocylindrales bacterium]
MLGVRRVLGVEAAYLAFTATEFGTWVAILVYAYHATGPASVGVVAVAQLVPAAFVAPFAATLGERFARDRALTAAYAFLALAMGATGVAILADAPALVVYAFAIVAQSALTSVRPMQAAIVPRLVGTAEQLTATNALSMVLEGVGSLTGPLATGVILALASPGAAFVAGGIACAVGALLVLRVAMSDPRDRAPGVIHRAEIRFFDGLRAVRHDPGGMLVIALIGARQVTAGALDVLLVIASIELLGMGGSGAGYLNAAAGFGAILGGASTLALAGRQRIAPFLLLGASGWGLFLVSIALIPAPAVALVLLAAAGVGLAVLEVTARTLLQRLLPVGALAGAFGVLEAMIFGGLAVGALLAGPLIAFVGLSTSLVALGLLMPLAAGLVLPTVMAGERRVEIPFREIALLRRLRLFAPVPAPAVESAARRLVPVSVSAGEPIIREGDIGDRFYVVVSGEVAVSREGREIRRLGPGDAFGEIALLRSVPRTASVTAVDDADLRALERDDFLLAITGTPAALDEADQVARGFLEQDAAADPQVPGNVISA